MASAASPTARPRAVSITVWAPSSTRDTAIASTTRMPATTEALRNQPWPWAAQHRERAIDERAQAGVSAGTLQARVGRTHEENHLQRGRAADADRRRRQPPKRQPPRRLKQQPDRQRHADGDQDRGAAEIRERVQERGVRHACGIRRRLPGIWGRAGSGGSAGADMLAAALPLVSTVADGQVFEPPVIRGSPHAIKRRLLGRDAAAVNSIEAGGGIRAALVPMGRRVRSAKRLAASSMVWHRLSGSERERERTLR